MALRKETLASAERSRESASRASPLSRWSSASNQRSSRRSTRASAVDQPLRLRGILLLHVDAGQQAEQAGALHTQSLCAAKTWRIWAIPGSVAPLSATAQP